MAWNRSVFVKIQSYIGLDKKQTKSTVAFSTVSHCAFTDFELFDDVLVQMMCDQTEGHTSALRVSNHSSIPLCVTTWSDIWMLLERFDCFLSQFNFSLLSFLTRENTTTEINRRVFSYCFMCILIHWRDANNCVLNFTSLQNAGLFVELEWRWATQLFTGLDGGNSRNLPLKLQFAGCSCDARVMFPVLPDKVISFSTNPVHLSSPWETTNLTLVNFREAAALIYSQR